MPLISIGLETEEDSNMPETETPERVQNMANHRLLHVLWTKAVGTPGYKKDEWRELESRLLRLDRLEKAETDAKHSTGQ